MRIGFVVNVTGSGNSGSTTHRLAAACARAGDDVWVMSSGSFSLDADDKVRALARSTPAGNDSSTEKYVAALNGNDRREEWISVSDLDVLMLRSNPSTQHAWAQHSGIHFGREAMQSGVIVLNDPNGLTRAMNKMYLQSYPETVRPRTVITRNADRIKDFVTAEGTVVLKPLQGSGGQGVFLVRPDDHANINQIIQAV